MRGSRDFWLFGLTLASAASALVSIAAAETLLAIACLCWLILRPARVIWPSYTLPLVAFMATTVLSLTMSPQPEIGMGSVRKFVLFAMAFLAANFVTTPSRARTSCKVLLIAGAAGATLALVQFANAYIKFRATHDLADDPMVLTRITGFMGHWITFSAEQLLVWCAAIPALSVLGRRWVIPAALIGAALVLGFTRPRKTLIGAALPVALVAAIASGLIQHRISMSFQQQKFGPDTGRIELFFGGLRMIRDHPLFGVGPERIHSEFPRYYGGADLAQANFYYGHLENNVVQIGAERGLLCLAAFLWFIFELYASLITMLKTAGEGTRWIVLSAVAALTGFMVAGFFEYNFGDSEVLLLFLFIVSIPYGVREGVAADV
ncbi:MAG: hypothetical protein DMG15_02635 [Acidobacteria bacterium]|nr:MAG: hypothetical protein DMG15_02635 [Acidobacteriota bacterium]